MNRTTKAVTILMSLTSMVGCMTGAPAEVGDVAQSIIPATNLTCASGGFEGDALPTLLGGAPWSLLEGLAGSARVDRGQLVVSRANLGAMTYSRLEPTLTGASQLGLEVNVAVQVDDVGADSMCPSLPLGNIGGAISDGARSAGFSVGRTMIAGADTTFVAVRGIGRCATPIAMAPVTLNLAEFHVYSIRLDATHGAQLYIDKGTSPVLTVPYDRLEPASALVGANLAVRTEHATASWDFVHFTACGVAPVVPPVTVPACGGLPCPGNSAPSCAGAAPSTAELWPPNHSMRPVRIIGITDPDGDEVAYTIDSVTSDEPANGQGERGYDDDGEDYGLDAIDQDPDGQAHNFLVRRPGGLGSPHGRPALLRAERSGMGNGRMYAMRVTATDSRGGTCQATVRVCVPHDQSGRGCVDDGQAYPGSTPVAPVVVPPAAPNTLRCPAPTSAPAGSPVNLAVTGVGAGATVRWSVTTAPSYTRAYRFASVYDDSDVSAMVATGTSTPFTSVIVGDFTVHAEATYPNGTVDQCDSTVSMVGHGLRVELSWNTQGTDVDLHALNASTGRWFSSNDCFYANRQPDGALAQANRRWLDTDDVDGEGPENIRVDTPTTDREYQIGIHFYSSHGQRTATRATVVIYCGEQRMGTFQRDLMGDRNNPDANDFWKVAAVQFSNSATCSVRTLGTLTTASNARAGN